MAIFRRSRSPRNPMQEQQVAHDQPPPVDKPTGSETEDAARPDPAVAAESREMTAEVDGPAQVPELDTPTRPDIPDPVTAVPTSDTGS